VAIGDTNQISTSPDGINWTTKTQLSTFVNVNSVAWNGLYWTAVGDKLATSRDAISWTIQTTPLITKLFTITWTGGAWIAGGNMGSNGKIITSTDGTTWTSPQSSPIDINVMSIATNGKILVAIGTGASNTIAYCNDIYGTTGWTGLGSSIFNVTDASYQCVKWISNKFVALSSSTPIAYSYDGINWNVAQSASTIFTSAFAVDCSIKQSHTIKFPANTLTTGDVTSFDNGKTWQTSRAIGQQTSVPIGYNGKYYIYGTTPPQITEDLSGQLIPISTFPVDVSINQIKSNGKQWLIGSKSTSNHQIMSSADGYNWKLATPSQFALNDSCIGLAWNGSVWVASSETTIVYSRDGLNWNLATALDLSGGIIEWNGSQFIVTQPAGAQPNNTSIGQSQDGIYWTKRTISTTKGPIQSIAWSGSTWIASTLSQDNTAGILINYGNEWSAPSFADASFNSIAWNGTGFVANTASQKKYTSYDGVNWTLGSTVSGKEIVWSKPSIGYMEIQQPTIVGGIGENATMATSADGICYTSLGKNVFSQSCSAVTWNGSIWVAGGEGENTLAYSKDGSKWTGLGAQTFTSKCNGVSWNGNTWLALGQGGNTMATSRDGISWTASAQKFDTQGISADWNGTVWVATGRGANTVATSANGSTWIFANANIGAQCNTVRWMGNAWILAGSNGFAYSTDVSNISWTQSIQPINEVFSIAWNGKIAVAGGRGGNTIATSRDGITWTGRGNVTFTQQTNSIAWNTKRWIATGVGGNTVAYSYDPSANKWYTAQDISGIFSIGQCVGTNSKIGANPVASRLYLNANDKLTVCGPQWYDDALSSDTAISLELNLP